tara:strand:+ start:35770 stop:36369 length:600 start_codon:yes stop_codon:yes gene_type:complete
MDILDDEKDIVLDHEYDGIIELDNHMPVWWLWLFYISIVFGIGYMFYYQVFGWGQNQIEEYETEMALAEEKYKSNNDGSSEAASFTWVYSDAPDAIAKGKEVFTGFNNLCFTCHGSAGEGLVGPNLTDNFWIHGCSAEELALSIKDGFPDKGMMPYGSGAALSNEDLNSLVSYIGSIQGTNPPNAKAIDENRAVECSIN